MHAVLSGTELSFAEEIRCLRAGFITWRETMIEHKTAIFRQINKNEVAADHDALEFPDGRILLLTCLSEGQEATVLQLPAEPRTAVESEAQKTRSLRKLNIRAKATRGHPIIMG